MLYDILILGGGPAGLTAALYAKRAGLSVMVLERSIYGGQITNTPEVENYPGILNITGVDLAMALYEQVTNLGVEIRLEEPESYRLDLSPKEVVTGHETYTAKTVIIANGAKRRKLGCPGEEVLSGKGVSYCATCDGAFFKGREVAIVGGGNTALEDALFLANNCKTVHLIHRRDEFRGNRILVDSVLERENIIIHYNTVPKEIYGNPKVAGMTLEDTQTGETTDLPVAGVFVAVGLVPDNAVFGSQLTLDSAGYIVAGEDCKTNLSGVFVAGDTRTKSVRQIITAAADGAIAAVEAANLINSGAKI